MDASTTTDATHIEEAPELSALLDQVVRTKGQAAGDVYPRFRLIVSPLDHNCDRLLPAVSN
jgi:hypothetical protein